MKIQNLSRGIAISSLIAVAIILIVVVIFSEQQNMEKELMQKRAKILSYIKDNCKLDSGTDKDIC